MRTRGRGHTGGQLAVMSLGQWLYRFSFSFLLSASFGLLILGQIKPAVTENVRTHVVDAFAPVIDALARPSATVDRVAASVQGVFDLYDENARLREENARLQQWRSVGTALQTENSELRGLLHFHAEPTAASITARVIGDSGHPFVHSFLITAGSRDGVHPGMAAVVGEGLVGRVTEVGAWSARVLLLSDSSSRIPVILPNGERGILAGDDTPQMKILYLANDSAVAIGQAVMTSGHGGIFPAQVPVGVISAVSKDGVVMTPLADLGRIGYVRLIDFALAGGAANQMGQDFFSQTAE